MRTVSVSVTINTRLLALSLRTLRSQGEGSFCVRSFEVAEFMAHNEENGFSVALEEISSVRSLADFVRLFVHDSRIP